ncbi:MAG: hypothetical protein ACLQGT_06940 [Terracidiphilus sp.]
MKRTTFILGAGFSVAAGFPLVRGLRELVVDFMHADRHPIYDVFLHAGQGFEDGQFAEGINRVDPESRLGFEELLNALQIACKCADPSNPCHLTLKVLRYGSTRLFWKRQNELLKVPAAYENFARLYFKPSEACNNAVVSFNWDLVMEKSLWDTGVRWLYSTSYGPVAVLKPHGSINWSSFLESGGRCDYEGWQKISSQSVLSYDASAPLDDPDAQEINPDFRYMLFPGDPELQEEAAKAGLIWTQVETILAQSEALVFIGYSLPEYDPYSRDVFRRAAVGKHIEVYNPSSEHLEQFRNLFRNHVQLVPQRFEECPYALVHT